MTRSQPYPSKTRSFSHKSAVSTATTRNIAVATHKKSATTPRSRVVQQPEAKNCLQMPEKLSKPVVNVDSR